MGMMSGAGRAGRGGAETGRGGSCWSCSWSDVGCWQVGQQMIGEVMTGGTARRSEDFI